MRGRKFGGALLLGVALLSVAGAAEAVVIAVGSGSGAPVEVVPIDVTLASEGSGGAGDAEPHRLHAPGVHRGGRQRRSRLRRQSGDRQERHRVPLPAARLRSGRRLRQRAVLRPVVQRPQRDRRRLAPLHLCGADRAGRRRPGAYPLTQAEVGSSAAGGVLLPTTGVNGHGDLGSAAGGAGGHRLGGGPGRGHRADRRHAGSARPDARRSPASRRTSVFDPATPVARHAKAAYRTAPSTAASALTSQSFAFTPTGCTPGSDCTGVHALVLSVDNDDADPRRRAALHLRGGDRRRRRRPASTRSRQARCWAAIPTAGRCRCIGSDGAITVDETPPPPACAGDCDGSGDGVDQRAADRRQHPDQRRGARPVPGDGYQRRRQRHGQRARAGGQRRARHLPAVRPRAAGGAAPRP